MDKPWEHRSQRRKVDNAKPLSLDDIDSFELDESDNFFDLDTIFAMDNQQHENENIDMADSSVPYFPNTSMGLEFAEPLSRAEESIGVPSLDYFNMVAEAATSCSPAHDSASASQGQPMRTQKSLSSCTTGSAAVRDVLRTAAFGDVATGGWDNSTDDDSMDPFHTIDIGACAVINRKPLLATKAKGKDKIVYEAGLDVCKPLFSSPVGGKLVVLSGTEPTRSFLGKELCKRKEGIIHAILDDATCALSSKVTLIPTRRHITATAWLDTGDTGVSAIFAEEDASLGIVHCGIDGGKVHMTTDINEIRRPAWSSSKRKGKAKGETSECVSVREVAVNRKGEKIAAGGHRKTLSIYGSQNATGLELLNQLGGGDSVGSVRWHEICTSLVSWTEDQGKISLYDTKEGKIMREINVGNLCAEYTTQGRRDLPMLFTHQHHMHYYIMCGFSNGAVDVFDIRNFRHVGGWRDPQLDVIGDIVKKPDDPSMCAAFGIAGFSVWKADVPDSNAVPGKWTSWLGTGGRKIARGRALCAREAYHTSGSFFQSGSALGVVDPRGILSFYDVNGATAAKAEELLETEPGDPFMWF